MSRLISTRRVASSGFPLPPPPLPSARSTPDSMWHMRRHHRCLQWRFSLVHVVLATHPHPTPPTNYNFDDINKSMDNYLDKLFYERYKLWKSDLHKHDELFDDPEIALDEGCPLELKDRLDDSNGICFPLGVAVPSTSEPYNPSTSEPVHQPDF
ncbi:hypothetical protein D8674_025647 [Pyrus ussuriensis x Pyrus communis]|uniref:Uncharacterized protein n=1 Tax=Pyrus ussuriensis x Pyrus communis TaxID=2448454 RepID=A0A5N5I7H2_9ROSA|nr:hypothetical protein D8674_025647 [Pyrus ussuriensis x Pyrus communis]